MKLTAKSWKPGICLIFAAILLLMAVAAQGRVLDNFESAAAWCLGNEGSLDIDRSTLEIVELEGKRALKVNFVLKPRTSEGSRYVTIVGNLGNKVIAAPVSIWVYGNGSNKSFRLRFRDDDSETFQVTYGSINWANEWRQVVFNDLSLTSCWGGQNKEGYKGVINGRPRFSSFILDYGNEAWDQELEGTIYLADFQAGPDFEEGVSLTLADTVLGSNGPGGLYWRNESDGLLTYEGTRDGKHLWRTDPANGKHYMYLDVDDAYIYGHPADSVIEVAVEYYDAKASGYGIYLRYRNPAGTEVSSPINWSMGKGWRTARFLLTNANFANNLNGADFRIVGDKLAADGLPVSIHKVTVRKLPVGTVTGTVVGIEGAKVTAVHENYRETPISVTTNADGSFAFTNLPEGNYHFYVTKEGYNREKLADVFVQAGGLTDLGSINMQEGFPNGLFIELGRFNDENGIFHVKHSTSENQFLAIVEEDGTEYRRTDVSRPDYFLEFYVDRTYFSSPQMETVEIEVTYWDKGTGSWRLDYKGGPAGSWIQGTHIKKSNTGQWKTHTIRLADARFDLNNPAFRLNCIWGGDDDDYFSKVVVRKIPSYTVEGRIVCDDFAPAVGLGNVEVKIVGLPPFGNLVFQTTTDSNGHFSVAGVPAGDYRIDLAAERVTNSSKLVTVSETQTNLGEIGLSVGWMGFEDVLWPLAASENSFALVETEKVSGRSALQATGIGKEQWMSTERIKLDFTQSYLISAFIKTENLAGSMRVAVQQVTEDNKDNGWCYTTPGNSALLSATGTTDWTRYDFVIDASQWKANTDTVKVYIYVPGQGKVWIDNLIFVPLLSGTLTADIQRFSPAQGGQVKLEFGSNILSQAEIDVLNEAEEVVAVIMQPTPVFATTGEISWDGKVNGEPVADGTYTIRLRLQSGIQTLERRVAVVAKNRGPAKPQITSPVIESGTTPVHNVQQLVIVGKVELKEDAQVTVKAVRRVEDDEHFTDSVLCDEDGNFIINVGLLPDAINTIAIVAYDDLGNPSEESAPLSVYYDPDAAMGLVNRINTELLSPKNNDGKLDKMEISFYVKDATTAKLALRLGESYVFEQTIQAGAGELVVLRWDGTNSQTGEFVPDGLYTYEVTLTGLGLIEAGEIRIDNTAPEQVSLLHPKAGMKLTTPPVLSWEAVDEAIRYELSYTQDSLWQSATTITLDGTQYQLPQLEKGTWYWQIVAIDEAGNRSKASEGFFELNTLDTSSFNLIYFAFGPNPFLIGRDRFTVSFTLQQFAQVELKVFNLAGRQVYSLRKSYEAGDHVISWDGCDATGRPLAKGAYLLRLEATNPNEEGTVVRQSPVLLLR